MFLFCLPFFFFFFPLHAVVTVNIYLCIEKEHFVHLTSVLPMFVLFVCLSFPAQPTFYFKTVDE